MMTKRVDCPKASSYGSRHGCSPNNVEALFLRTALGFRVDSLHNSSSLGWLGMRSWELTLPSFHLYLPGFFKNDKQGRFCWINVRILIYSSAFLNRKINIQEHENDLGLSNYGLTTQRSINTPNVIVNYHVVQENKYMAGIITY